jgi:mono/diheme cytochrome c family protein
VNARPHIVVLLAYSAGLVLVQAASSTAKLDFGRDIQPIFLERCHSCHGPEKHKGGLRLDRKSDALAGGDSGKIIVPGKSAHSLIISNVVGLNPETVMPPKGEQLSAEQIAKLRAWIDQGAEWPEDIAQAGAKPKSDHWAFKVPQGPRVPQARSPRWVRNPVDAFVLSRLEKQAIAPAPEAGKVTLIRRLSFDLLGLPPAIDEVQRFVADKRPEAYEELVDRFLRSPHFGERWARHWLDLARYADSDGYEKDGIRPYAYLYRNWVIDAINRDLPFDQFTLEQIAGDLLPDATIPQKTATGFHRQTLTNKEGGVDQEEFRCKATVDRATTTGAIWLGLTVGCAECHSHKYDPITQKEFYQFYAFFNNTTEQDLVLDQQELARYNQQKERWGEENGKLKHALNSYLTNEFVAAQMRWEQSFPLTTNAVTGSTNRLTPAIEAILRKPVEQRDTNQLAQLTKYYREQVDPVTREFDAKVAAHAKKEPKAPELKASILAENEKPRPTHIHVRGDFLRKGEEVQPGTFSILHEFKPHDAKPNRLDLAKWLFDPANPLTARVTVNQIWIHLFGRGLVSTVDDFGTRGEAPSHPELLDWLATEFPRLGWSRKALIRLIVTSATYRQSSAIRSELLERDPNNVLLARQNRYRLEAEVVRDSFLACSGLLAPRIGGPSIRPPLPPDITAVAYANSIKWNESQGADRYRRGLYIFLQRTIPYPMLMTFDAPDSHVTCTRRERSNTPLQALTLLNDNVFFECAQTLGKKMGAERVTDPLQQATRIFQICLSRSPTEDESDRLRQFWKEQHRLAEANPDNVAKIVGVPKPASANVVDTATLVALARTVMNLDEFVTRE